MRIAWLTDMHFNFCPDRVQELLDSIDSTEPDAVLIGGDIGEAPDVIGYLERFTSLGCPIFFVLGNHDYYRGSIRQVRADVDDLCQDAENLYYLTTGGVVELTDDRCRRRQQLRCGVGLRHLQAPIGRLKIKGEGRYSRDSEKVLPPFFYSGIARDLVQLRCPRFLYQRL